MSVVSGDLKNVLGNVIMCVVLMRLTLPHRARAVFASLVGCVEDDQRRGSHRASHTAVQQRALDATSSEEYRHAVLGEVLLCSVHSYSLALLSDVSLVDVSPIGWFVLVGG